MKERVKLLCKKKGVSMNTAEKEIGLAKGYISKLEKSNPNMTTLQKMAEYFDESVEYLMTGTEDKKESPVLTARDERDIAKDLNRIMEKLSAGEDGPASYDGEELDPEAAELFRDELDIALRRLKIINKEKYGHKRK